MRKTSPQIDLLLSQTVVKPVYIFDIVGSNVNLKYTTNFTDLVVPNLGTYDAACPVAKFDAPVMEKASNRETYKITFVDPSFAMRSLAETALVGARVTVRMLLVNTMGYALGGAEPDAILLNEEDITIGFDGIIDSRTYATNPIESSNTFVIECSTPLAGLSMINSYLTSKSAVQNLDPTDTCYDDVHISSGPLNLLWGKAGANAQSPLASAVFKSVLGGVRR